jgi:hypothetical protein
MYRKYPALKVPYQYPPVLVVKVGWREGKVLDSGYGKVTGSRLFWVML